MSVAASLGISLMLQDQGIRDTVVMIQAAADRSLMETLAVTGQFIVSLVVLVLLGAVVSFFVGALILRVNPVRSEEGAEEASATAEMVPGLGTN